MHSVKNVNPEFYGKEKVYKILLKIAPPVMFALLIQALYNVVDSFFVGRYSDPDGLTALSVIYTVQLLIIALAVGTGVGVNTFMAKLYAENKNDVFGYFDIRAKTLHKHAVQNRTREKIRLRIRHDRLRWQHRSFYRRNFF